MDKTGKSPGVPWITQRNVERSVAFGGWQDIDREILLLSGKVEQRTGALSGTFHPASPGERITFSDNLQQSEKSGALCGRITFFLFQTATSGDPEFIFEDIPVEKLPLHLAVEAGNLSISLTVSKI